MTLSWSRWRAARSPILPFVLGLLLVTAAASPAQPPTPLAAPIPAVQVVGRYLVDPNGRVVILRGVNLAGNSKVPPFLPTSNPADLDRIQALGMNMIRLVFTWEAYEPAPGCYDEAYLDRLRWVAAEAWARGIYTIVDIHQDGFARCLSRGSGDGFPFWAVSQCASTTSPDNGPSCKYWAVLMATDPNMHRSFADFYANRGGVRSRYLVMLQRIAASFATIGGVIGYDPMNEPWGDEARELAPLHHDAAIAIRSAHPAAILFLEGHVTTNCGLQTKLPRPDIPNVVYAPHYYKTMTIVQHGWRGGTLAIRAAFARMEEKAAEWNVPLLVGEFGVPADADRAGDYVSYLYDQLDEHLASGAQWNYTPGWNPRDKDGWNDEDFTILTPDGVIRPNFAERPAPRAVAGRPVHFQYQALDRVSTMVLTWEHHPERGETEVFVPNRLFPRGSALFVEGDGVVCWRDEARQRLVCRSARPGLVRVRLSAL